MNAITTTPEGSYQYKNLTGSTKLGGETMGAMTWDNMVGNMKSVINPLISGDSKAGSALSTFKSGKSLYDYYQGENMNEQEIEFFIKSDLTWHKSTKNFGSSENFFNILWNNALDDKLNIFKSSNFRDFKKT